MIDKFPFIEQITNRTYDQRETISSLVVFLFITISDKEEAMTYPTTEQVEKARQASLADFFTQNGFETEHIRNELHVKGYGGLYINTDTNEWYCFSQADKHGGRNAINCLTDIIGMNFKSAVEALSGANMTYMDYRRDTPKLPQAKKPVLPERADNMRKESVV